MKKRGNILAIMSAKGGTGKTTTTANLAATLANEFNRKILAVDTNITTASLGLHFGIDAPKITIYDVLKREYPIESAIVNYSDNLDVVPASLICFDEDENKKSFFSVAENVRRLSNHYNILFSQIAKRYDIIILDSAPGFGFESLANFQIADGVLFVTNPDYPALIATAKAISYSKFVGVPMGGIILNKVTNKSYEMDHEEIEELVEARIAAEIPLDKNIPESVAVGKPITLYRKYSPASITYKQLGGMLLGEDYRLNLLEFLKLKLG